MKPKAWMIWFYFLGAAVVGFISYQSGARFLPAVVMLSLGGFFLSLAYWPLRKVALVAVLGFIIVVVVWFLKIAYDRLMVTIINVYDVHDLRVLDACNALARRCFVVSVVSGFVLGICLLVLYRLVRNRWRNSL